MLFEWRRGQGMLTDGSGDGALLGGTLSAELEEGVTALTKGVRVEAEGTEELLQLEGQAVLNYEALLDFILDWLHDECNVGSTETAPATLPTPGSSAPSVVPAALPSSQLPMVAQQHPLSLGDAAGEGGNEEDEEVALEERRRRCRNTGFSSFISGFSSLQAVQLASCIEDEFAMMVEPTALYVSFTPHQLAHRLAPHVGAGGESSDSSRAASSNSKAT
jgi:hypothetical protein